MNYIAYYRNARRRQLINLTSPGLYAGGPEKIGKKIGEEATEVVIAGLTGNDSEIVNEMSDLWFHCLVLLAHRNISPEQVLVELSNRFGRSGIEEKASRRNSEILLLVAFPCRPRLFVR